MTTSIYLSQQHVQSAVQLLSFNFHVLFHFTGAKENGNSAFANFVQAGFLFAANMCRMSDLYEHLELILYRKQLWP